MEIAVIVLALLALGFWHAHEKKKAEDEAVAQRQLQLQLRIAESEERLLQHKVELEDAKLDQARAIRALLTSYVNEHRQVLSTKRRQGTLIDSYNRQDISGWTREIIYFADKVMDGRILEYFAEPEHRSREIAYDLIRLEIEILLDSAGFESELDYDPKMTGVSFEHLVAQRLINLGFEVQHTPLTGDQGADLIAKFKGETIVIQCKRSASTISNKAVQEAFAGCKFHGAQHAWVVSDAPFSRHAQQLASTLSVRLVDFDQVETAL